MQSEPHHFSRNGNFIPKVTIMNPSRLNDIQKQKRLILLCCLVYSFAYVGRYSYNANIGSLIAFYGVSRADAGMVSTFFFFSYGAGQLLNALFCKFYPKKYVIAGALIGSSLINLILFFLPSFGVIKYFWLLNGICQSMLWTSLLQTLGETIDQSMMKRAVFAMSLSVAAEALCLTFREIFSFPFCLEPA